MENKDQLTAERAQIIWTIEKRAEAVQLKNIELVLSFYAPEIVSFDVVNLLQSSGLDVLKKRLETWFSVFKEGPIGFEISEPSIVVNDKIAFCHSLNHVLATKKDNKIIDMFWRETTCYQKISGKWLIVHAHDSVPFDPETGKASLDLKA